MFRLISLLALLYSTQEVYCFTSAPTSFINKRVLSSSPSAAILLHSSSSSSSSDTYTPSDTPDTSKFPVLSRISGKQWTGECRYVNAELQHAKSLKITGGVQYDIDGTTCQLSSFLTLPNGKTREVVMRGQKLTSTGAPTTSMRLESTAEEGGPIYMILTEVMPDTVLINEIDRFSGKVIMTSSLSLVEAVGGEKELVQVSHEVGTGGSSGADTQIEGHQVWRLRQQPIQYDDFDVRGTTGR